LKISVIIPVYNEVNTILQIIKKVRESNLKSGLTKEIIIIDDYSTDGTLEKLKYINNPDRVKVYYHEKNQGKGAALRTGFKHCTGDIILIQDADLEYDPNDYPCLLDPILNDNADVVYGSRFLGAGPHRVLFFWHYMGNKWLTTLSNIFTNLNMTDMETCFKVFKKEVIDTITIKENRFGVEPEITAKIARGQWRIYEVGISYYGRDYSQGKKIGWKDGFRAFYVILKYGLLKWK
tara:strand:- start:2883 stop:3587 length:705 start_codon:yes stop_codon:yes gene_type:complete